MADVLVKLSGGQGLIRSDDERFEFCLSSDVNTAPGQPVAYQDRYRPERMHLETDRFLVGGLLPPGAVSAEVVDDSGVRVTAAVGNGAYVAVLEHSEQRFAPIVCCRDADGRPVRRPWVADYPSTRVTDAQEPCPACGSTDWDEYTPFEQWRGGSGGPNGTTVPNPVVSCRACGYEEPEPTFMTMHAEAVDGEDEETRAARIAHFQAEHRKREWFQIEPLLRNAQFSIYAANGWPARLGSRSWSNDVLSEVTVQHFEHLDEQSSTGHTPRLFVSTHHDTYRVDELEWARSTLGNWIDTEPEAWPEASHAAVTLWQSTCDRQRRAQVLTAAQSEQVITIDDTSVTMLLLSGPQDRWVATARYGNLSILIAARDLVPGSIRLSQLTNPVEQLLGPEPPDGQI